MTGNRAVATLEPAMKYTRSFLLAGLQTSVALVLFGCSPFASAPQPTPRERSTLTAAEQSRLAQLEARPLIIPALPADLNCPDGPQSKVSPYGGMSAIYLAESGGSLYGTGPVYGVGGGRTDTPKNSYFNVTVFTDPTVRDVVLVRGRQLDRRLDVFFVGPWAAGPVVGNDTIDGKHTELRAELALPAGRPPSNPNAAPGWGIWKLRIGIARENFIGCTGFQFDTAAGSEVFVAAG